MQRHRQLHAGPTDSFLTVHASMTVRIAWGWAGLLPLLVHDYTTPYALANIFSGLQATVAAAATTQKSTTVACH